jgi:aspartate aminotransferase-like enzyme
MYKKLFIPGPVDVLPECLEKMATPMIGHRTKEATVLQKSIGDKLRRLMFTDNTILLSTSSGSGLMEGAIRCCTKKRAAVFSVGSFGDRWYEMALANDIPADKFVSAQGSKTSPEMVRKALQTGLYDVVTVTHNETSSGIMNPCDEIGEVIREFPGVLYLVDAVSSLGGSKIEVDKWGIDICITSTQKCLGLPPGLSLCSVTDKAIEAARGKENRGFYLDLVKLYDQVKKNDQYPSTPALSQMFALDYQLSRILDEEGLENRFDRHTRMAEKVRAWAEKYFSLFADADCRSNTVTCINNTRGLDVAELNKKLGEIGFSISNGYGKFKDVTFRIATMADVKEDVLDELLGHIEVIWGLEA